MPLIYEPRGKAREYSPLALNLYKGCDHGCTYCYVPGIFARQPGYVHSDVKPRNNVIEQLKHELKKGPPDKQILLSFTGDPYCLADEFLGLTRKALQLLSDAGAMVAMLTKGGSRCLRDLDLFKAWPVPLKIGATLTFFGANVSREYEPQAAEPADRLDMLKQLHEAGIKTWASIEPVVCPRESLAIIRASLPYVDAYKIGKLNHIWNNTDWPQFLRDAVAIMREAKKPFYVKADLRKFCPPDIHLSPAECDMDSLALRMPTSLIRNPQSIVRNRAQAELFA